MKKIISHQTLCNCQGAREAEAPPGAEPRKPDAETAGEEARRTLATGPERDCCCFQAGELSLDPSGHVSCLPRKEVIQPHLPVRLPCYDFTPLTLHTFDASAPFGFGRRLRVQTTRVV